MAKHLLLILLLLATIIGCTPTAAPSPTPTPITSTATPVDFSAPEAVGRAFLEAWEKNAYDQMYALLAPSLRAGLTAADFERAYNNALNTTATLSVSALPKQLAVEGERAWIEFEATWETAVFGALPYTNRLNLIRENQQWWVDWRRETIHPDLADGNAFAVEYQTPPRANIYDRNGAGLAIPSTIVTVGVVPEQITDEAGVLAALAAALGLPAETIQARYAGQPRNWYIPIADISGEESLAYDTALNQPGIQRRERAGRLYPLHGVGSHVVGWISTIPAESLGDYQRRGYRNDALVGVAGLEAWGESFLAGVNGGRLSLVKADGSYLRGVAEQQPERGRAIYATLDRDLQAQAEAILGDRAGAIVALDVETGAVRALVSGPGFDNNIFVRPTDDWLRAALLNDYRRPLLNRATQGAYPLGSVFKIVTIAAGLESGQVNPGSSFYCPGYWNGLGVANRKACWLATGHGNINLTDGLVQSCDVVFYEVGYMLHTASPDMLPSYGRAFGLGRLTGLAEIPEEAGLMPDAAWKRDTYFETWVMGDSINLSIGQGFLLVTPLQVAQMLAAVANGGELHQPYLVERIAAGSGYAEQLTPPKPTGQLPISAANLAIIQQALRDVTSAANGTASHRFAGLEVATAGKTGTAEAPGAESLPHSWFAGYFPADAPEIAAVVLVENGGEGSSVAAPMFRQLVEAYYGLPLTPLPTLVNTGEGE